MDFFVCAHGSEDVIDEADSPTIPLHDISVPLVHTDSGATGAGDFRITICTKVCVHYSTTVTPTYILRHASSPALAKVFQVTTHRLNKTELIYIQVFFSCKGTAALYLQIYDALLPFLDLSIEKKKILQASVHARNC